VSGREKAGLGAADRRIERLTLASASDRKPAVARIVVPQCDILAWAQTH
jgi:hypothetical protein